jgi:hypothetical protein
LATYSDNWLSAQLEQPLSPKKLNAQLLTLQTAFPTVVRNYDANEFKAMQSLWYEIFKNVPEEIMQEAIRQFIINDRKGFFPSPGQIVGVIEQIVKEQKERQEEISRCEHWARIAEIEKLIAQGEHCGNCVHCRRNREPPNYSDKTYDKYLKAWNDEEKEKYLCDNLYCTNPDSYKYEGDDSYKYGTAETIRCEHFARRQEVATNDD